MGRDTAAGLDRGTGRRLPRLRLMGLCLVLLVAPACMRNRLAKDYRRPWTRATTVAEDAAWTLESAALGVVAVGSLGMIDPYAKHGWRYRGGLSFDPLGDDDEDDDWEDDDDGGRERSSGGSHGATVHRAVGRRSSSSGGGGSRRVRGTRTSR